MACASKRSSSTISTKGQISGASEAGLVKIQCSTTEDNKGGELFFPHHHLNGQVRTNSLTREAQGVMVSFISRVAKKKGINDLKVKPPTPPLSSF